MPHAGPFEALPVIPTTTRGMSATVPIERVLLRPPARVTAQTIIRDGCFRLELRLRGRLAAYKSEVDIFLSGLQDLSSSTDLDPPIHTAA